MINRLLIGITKAAEARLLRMAQFSLGLMYAEGKRPYAKLQKSLYVVQPCYS